MNRLFHGQSHCAAIQTSQKFPLLMNTASKSTSSNHTRAARTAGVKPLVAITRGSGTDAGANVSSSLTSEPRSWTATLSVSSMLPNASPSSNNSTSGREWGLTWHGDQHQPPTLRRLSMETLRDQSSHRTTWHHRQLQDRQRIQHVLHGLGITNLIKYPYLACTRRGLCTWRCSKFTPPCDSTSMDSMSISSTAVPSAIKPANLLTSVALPVVTVC